MATTGPTPVPITTPSTPVGPPTTSPSAVNPAVASIPTTTPTLIPLSQIDQSPGAVSASSVPSGNVVTLTVPVVEIAVQAATITGNSNVTVYSPKPGGLAYAVQFNAGNNQFGGVPRFEYDWTSNVVKVGNSYSVSQPTDLLVQGNLIVGNISGRTGSGVFPAGYGEFGRLRYLDDVGWSVNAHPYVYGFTGMSGNGAMDENWFCMVNEPGHEYNTATAMVLPLVGHANSDTALFGISFDTTNAKGTRLNNIYYNDYYSDPYATGWNQALRLTPRDLFLPRLSEATANKFLAYNTATGRVSYTDGTGNSSVVVQEEGSNVVSSSTFNFVGSGVTASNVGGVATITVAGGLSGIAVQEEGTNVVASTNTINFVGSSVTASNVSGVATITVSSSSGIAVQEEGTNVVATANTVNFVGAGVTASNVGGVATVTIPGGGSGITVQEEGSNIANAASIVNFVGSGVTASNVGGVATVTVPLVAPGGSNTQIQFNDNSSFGGNSKFTFNKTTGNVDVTAGNISVTTGNFTGTTNGVTLGYRYMPQTVLPVGNGNVTLDSAYTGGHLVKWANGEMIIIAPSTANGAIPVGATINIFNASGTGNANIYAGTGPYPDAPVLVGPRVITSPGILSYVQIAPCEQVTLVNLGASAGSVENNHTIWFCYGSAVTNH